MLPKFPNFKELELSDIHDIQSISSRYLPYSDFNFVSMWSWDTANEMKIAELNGNLVVKFTDYLTDEQFYSFLGDNKTSETALTLLDLSEREGLPARLSLIPEASLSNMDPSALKWEESRDHFDYILGLDKLSNFRENGLRDHANFSRRFLDENHHFLEIKSLDLRFINDRESVLFLTNIWKKNKEEQNKSFSSHLQDAVNRYLLIADDYYGSNFVSVGIFHKTKLVAFTINELVDEDYATCHFMKSDNTFKGIYSHLITTTAQEIIKRGRKFVNFEQDLGLKNLRQAKLTYEPVAYLKKFDIHRA